MSILLGKTMSRKMARFRNKMLPIFRVPAADGGLGYGGAICGNHALLGNTVPSENTLVSQVNAEEDARTYNQRGQRTLDEDRSLEKHVKKLGEKKWSMIAKNLPDRIGKQCRERWLNHLSPDIKTTAWTEKEEKVIVALHRKHGNKWAKMAKRIPGRPESNFSGSSK
ncbi:hypothetical protein SEVIR_3G228401v4 [Setaria viridis]|uniref:HTH myb-type domain-containing protein n=1 Tax=Setaria viridis TaxID=4556 RepID=A0A4U6VC47_SETVI|nr:transcription factor MYB98-like [Setaria viridis]TKW27000.1 hypothetical protein SEVIR_3G228401v2 [Setaria viridis]